MEKLLKLRAQFEEYGIDSLLVTNDQNRRYLTGFTGSAGTVVITKTEAVLFVDFRYINQAKEQAKDFTVVLVGKEGIQAEVAKFVASASVSRLGFEEGHMTFQLYTKYKGNVQAELIPVASAVENLRMVKTAEEIQTIRTAVEIADATFTHILEYIRPGVSEIEVANELEFFMRKQGAASSAFDIIVASGYRGALPHGLASSKVIEKGELVTLDFGAYFEGYRSDITRTIAVGEPKEELKEIYNIVLEALNISLAGIRPGMTGREADALSRDYISAKGFGEQYGHGSGHGIGLDIHEEIFMSTKCDKLIAPGMVLTVEPGIYVPGLGGVRIEDDVLITDSGNEILTTSSKELIVL